MTVVTRTTGLLLHSEAAARIAFLFLLLPPVTMTDIRERRIPLAVPALITCAAVLDGITAWIAGGSALCGAAPLLIARATTGGIGWGDVVLAASLGALVGADRVLAASGYAALLALASVGLGRALDGVWSSEASIPFGPYLIAGAICAMVA